MSDRVQRTVVEGKFSSPLQVNCVVPQGSILGPLLFICYISDLPQHFSLTRPFIYADETAGAILMMSNWIFKLSWTVCLIGSLWTNWVWIVWNQIQSYLPVTGPSSKIHSWICLLLLNLLHVQMKSNISAYFWIHISVLIHMSTKSAKKSMSGRSYFGVYTILSHTILLKHFIVHS